MWHDDDLSCKWLLKKRFERANGIDCVRNPFISPLSLKEWWVVYGTRIWFSCFLDDAGTVLVDCIWNRWEAESLLSLGWGRVFDEWVGKHFSPLLSESLIVLSSLFTHRDAPILPTTPGRRPFYSALSDPFLNMILNDKTSASSFGCWIQERGAFKETLDISSAFIWLRKRIRYYVRYDVQVPFIRYL